ncbi:MAG: delta-60 repeat domain-containing protein [Verrucomicrobiales bacterium]|nr:delta-60 repeat domain-containing protein [Verrucomicrobiales bacterium]
MSVPRTFFLSLGLATLLELSLLLSLPAAEPGHAASAATLVSATAQDTTGLPAAGMLDPDFVPDIGLGDEGIPFDNALRRGILIQPDDKILIGGYGLTRLHPDGKRDTNFISGIPKSNEFVTEFFFVTDITLDTQGRILVCGTFPSVHDIARQGIARLHPDGQLDESFDPGKLIEGGIVKTLAVQTNGQILIAGTFTSVGGLSRRGIARLNEEGTHDTSFDPLAGATPTFINSILIQEDGALLVSGPFTALNALIRLKADGTPDSSFSIPVFLSVASSPRGSMYTALQRDGRIIAAGDFVNAGASLRGEKRPGLARFYASDEPFFPPSFVSDSMRRLPEGQSSFRISGAPRFRIVTEAASRLDPPDWTPIRTNIMGKTALTLFDNAASLYPNRFYRLVSP